MENVNTIKTVKVDRTDFLDAIVAYELVKCQTASHVHLKINEAGEFYTYVDVSYTVSCAERDGGFPIVLMHSAGYGDYPDDYVLGDFDSEEDLLDCLESNIRDAEMDDLEYSIREINQKYKDKIIID